MKFFTPFKKRTPSGELRDILANKITVRVPRTWHELSNAEATEILRLFAMRDVNADIIPSMAFCLINGISVLAWTSADRTVCSLNGKVFILEPDALARISAPLSFLNETPAKPWRPERIGKHAMTDADWNNLTFGDYLVIDNFYQGIIATGSMALADNILPLLCADRPKKKAIKLEAWERMAVLLWLGSVKQEMARRYPNLFSVEESGSGNVPDLTKEGVMGRTNAQIRALTKGDLTKEEAILSQPLHRALAELDAQAREYAEISKASKS